MFEGIYCYFPRPASPFKSQSSFLPSLCGHGQKQSFFPVLSIGISMEEKNKEGGKECKVRSRRDQREAALPVIRLQLAQTERHRAALVLLAVSSSSVQVTVLAHWGLPP